MWGDWSHLPELTEKQRYVLKLRYGFLDGHEYSLTEIADLMGISKIAVHRLEHRALARLRRGVNATYGTSL